MGFRRRTRSFKVWLNPYIIITDLCEIFVLFIIAKYDILDQIMPKPDDVPCDLGTGSSSLWATGLMADGKLGYDTVCFDFELMPEMLVRQK